VFDSEVIFIQGKVDQKGTRARKQKLVGSWRVLKSPKREFRKRMGAKHGVRGVLKHEGSRKVESSRIISGPSEKRFGAVLSEDRKGGLWNL